MSGIVHAFLAAVGAVGILAALGLTAAWWVDSPGPGRKAPADRLPWPVTVVLTLLWGPCVFAALCLTAIYATRLFLELLRFGFGWPA